VTEDNDLALVERCRRGDQSAFAELVHRYNRPLYNAAFRVLGHAEDASDVTQEVFLKIAERLDDYDPQYKFFSWIYRIAVNEAINVLRERQREVEMGEDDEYFAADDINPEVRLGNAQISRRIQHAMMTLKVDDRVVLVLRHFSEHSYREIADILGIEEKTVKSRLFEARGRLGTLLSDLRAS
jgi:RNA polymerase sigma-70 factor, ECF subfamily